MLGEIFQRLRTEFPACTLIIAPRHVERAGEIRMRLARLGLDVSLRSDAGTARTSPPNCVLLDSTGELQNWYAVATIVFVGKSLTAHGGQNPVEPILAGKPVLFGPHMENFAALAQALVENKAAIQIQNPDSLQEKVAWLLREPEAAARLVANGQTVLSRHSGATGRTATLVLNLESAARARDGALRK
jgi:3-deoxy-D-manno-octulosonic-acid transferase